MNIKLTSDYTDNSLPGVGKAELQDNFIKITAEKETKVTLFRGSQKVILLLPSQTQKVISGPVLVDDVYVLEKNDQKLEIKVDIKKIRPEGDIFIDQNLVYDATSQKRKTTMTIGVLVLILLILSVLFGINQKNKKEFIQTSKNLLKQAVADYEKAVAEESVDKNSSRKLFVSAKETAFKLKEDGYKDDDLTKLISDILSKEADILGEIKTNTNDLLDLTLQVSGFSGDQIASSGEIMFVLDKQNKSVIQVDVNGKNAKIIAGKDIVSGVNQIASYEDKLFSIKDDGIYELTNKKNKVSDEDALLFYLYSGNIYLIKKDVNEIFRLNGVNGIFSEKKEWLAPGVEADLSKVIDMAIDGSIWLLSSSGKITKFTNGNPQNVQMRGIIENLTNPTAVYTNEKLKYVYVLEREKSRVVVLEKNGDFKMQYLSDEIKNAKDLVVSEEENRAILLTGPKLIYFDLK